MATMVGEVRTFVILLHVLVSAEAVAKTATH